MKINNSQLQKKGYVVLEQVVSHDAIKEYREIILSNQNLMKNTRPTPSARHLAGFHRFAQFGSLHSALVQNRRIQEFFSRCNEHEEYIDIGLSDITINRSQCWHTDLLRGEFSRYLDEQACWGEQSGGVYKCLLYLQGGTSLEVAEGLHLTPTPLNDDQLEAFIHHAMTTCIPVESGDVIIMDIRLPHRGSTEAQMANKEFEVNPKILVSTVLGSADKPLTTQMKQGNADRQAKWDLREEQTIA